MDIHNTISRNILNSFEALSLCLDLKDYLNERNMISNDESFGSRRLIDGFTSESYLFDS